MAARVLDGVAVANQIRAEVAPEVAAFRARVGRPPGLGIVLVGEDPASEIYVRGKLKSAGDAGLRADLLRLPAAATLSELLEVVERTQSQRRRTTAFSSSRRCPKRWGPTPNGGCSTRSGRTRTSMAFIPTSVGLLVQNRARLVPCTPAGVIELLERSRIPIAGARAVVIGRSDIVGKPMALLLLHRHATVTMCHSRTPNLPAVAAEADILVAAIGRPAFVTRDFIKPGATVIDVGITSLTDRSTVERLYPAGSKRRETFERRGSITIGDVHPSVEQVAGAISPVPGGVGPLTIAMLLKNTLTAAVDRADGA